jgi:trehalose 6-phosphate synthase
MPASRPHPAWQELGIANNCRAGTSMDEPTAGSIILISNRGPNDFVWQQDRWAPKLASGGLVSMIDPLARRPEVAWFCCVSEPPDAGEARPSLFTTSADQTDPAFHIVPVPLPALVYQAYYGAISNEVLWMLQHHLVGQFGYSSLDVARHRAWSDGYLEANRRMAAAVLASGIHPRAFLIQDYHFYPLPALLRQAFHGVPSLHYTHIPFPGPATLKLILRQWRDAILLGMLGADVIGLQTLRDTRSFLACCEELLQAQVDYKKSTVLAADGRVVRVRAFPASTDPAAVQQTMRSSGMLSARQRLAPFLEKLTVVRVDRLDPSKNQIIGFKAFGRLLEIRPDLRGRLRFLAFLVPSRTDLGVYREYRAAVYALIREVNTTYAQECGFDPIEVFYTNDREQALLAMEQCDALLVNSREDGMNLVVKEWGVVSNRPGMVILSETCGVASEIGSDALLVSPLDIEGTAQALAQAIEMSNGERWGRLAGVRTKVFAWTAAHWLSAQLDALHQVSPGPAAFGITGALKLNVAARSRFSLVGPGRRPRQAGQEGRRQGYQ